MTPRADELRARVTELDEAGWTAGAIAYELGIMIAHVDRILDSLDAMHDPFYYMHGPNIEPLRATQPRADCGCEIQAGHSCRPSFVTPEEWAVTEPFVSMPCGTCGQPRHISTKDPREIRLAAERTCVTCANKARQDYLDEMAVERLLAGQPPTTTTRAERQAAVTYLTRHGQSASTIARRIGVTVRTVERLRAKASA